MISSGLRLALVPAVLLAMSAIVSQFPVQRERAARALAVVGCGAALALLISDTAAVAAQGNVDAAFGASLAGANLLLRADSVGVSLAMISIAAALLALLDAVRCRGRSASVLLCAAGACGAALAGNAVMLFAGLELANVGSLLLMSRGARPSRGLVAAFVVQHFAALGLLAAAVLLTVSTGTSDPAAIPAGAVTAIIALPWALAGVARLLAPAVWPVRDNAAWFSIAAVPAGAAVLLRLRNLTGPLPAAAVVTIEVAGALAALGGAVVAARRTADAAATGRGLLIIAAGLATAVIPVTEEAAGPAAAAALVALELGAASAPLWITPNSSRRSRAACAAALLIAGNLPLGFGMTASVLVVGSLTSYGVAGSALVAALGIAVVVGAVASCRAAAAVLGTIAAQPEVGLPPNGVFALLLSFAGAAVPGAAAAWLVAPLAPGSLTASADAAAVRGPAGGWAGGYLLAAAAWLVVVVISASTLAQRGFARGVSGVEPATRPLAAWLPMLHARRMVRRPLSRGRWALDALDRWLVAQPRMPLVLVAAFIAVLFLH